MRRKPFATAVKRVRRPKTEKTKVAFTKLAKTFDEDKIVDPNIEAILNRIRSFRDVAGNAGVRELSFEELDWFLQFTTKNEVALDALNSGCAVGGGTSFFWARPDARLCVDVLFIDEAAQMSLADVLAVSQAAKSIVLLGDPRQLEQPIQGSHPDGVGVSALIMSLDLTLPFRLIVVFFLKRLGDCILSFALSIRSYSTTAA
jgi:hypothetical protein